MSACMMTKLGLSHEIQQHLVRCKVQRTNTSRMLDLDNTYGATTCLAPLLRTKVAGIDRKQLVLARVHKLY